MWGPEASPHRPGVWRTVPGIPRQLHQVRVGCRQSDESENHPGNLEALLRDRRRDTDELSHVLHELAAAIADPADAGGGGGGAQARHAAPSPVGERGRVRTAPQCGAATGPRLSSTARSSDCSLSWDPWRSRLRR